MSKRNQWVLWVLPLSFAVGCGAPEPTEGDPAEAAEVAEATPAIAVDVSELAPLANKVMVGGDAPAAVPAERLSLEVFRPEAASARLLQTAERLSLVQAVGDRLSLESESWSLEADAAGSVLAVRKPRIAGPAEPLDEAALAESAIARLGVWGVPEGEMGRVLQRKAMVQSREDGVAAAPALYAHKTFVFRAIGGIEVQGHRAVITHAPDGVLERVLVRWPALAASGHALRTPLGLPEIEARVRGAMT
jgi:hypothetical protein